MANTTTSGDITYVKDKQASEEINFVEVVDAKDKPVEEKGMYVYEEERFIPFGVTSFAELDAMEEADEFREMVDEDSDALSAMIGNIMRDPEIEDKAAAIDNLTNEFVNRVRGGVDEKSLTDEQILGIGEDETPALSKAARVIGKAVTKREGGVDYPAKDFAYTPDKDKPSTWKLRLSQGSAGNITVAQLGRAAAALGKGFRGNKVQLPSSAVSSVKARIRREYKKLGVDTADIPDSVKSTPEMVIFKDNNGDYRWIAKYSNNFRDDDTPPEIITAQAHRDFVKSVESGESEYPELWIWHEKALAIGTTDWIAVDDHGDIVYGLASGTFYDAAVAKSLEQAEDLAVSHGMPAESVKRDDNDKTVITGYKSIEISVLPAYAAANRWTSFKTISKESDMLDTDKAQQIKDMGIDDNVLNSIVERNKDQADKNRELDIDKKEVSVEEVETAEVVDTTEEVAEVEQNETEGIPEPNTDEEYLAGQPTRQEVVEMGEAIVAGVSNILEEQVKSVVEAVAKDVETLKQSNAEQLEKHIEKSPRTLAQMLSAKSFGVEQSNIDKDKVNGPEETEAEDVTAGGLDNFASLFNGKGKSAADYFANLATK